METLLCINKNSKISKNIVYRLTSLYQVYQDDPCSDSELVFIFKILEYFAPLFLFLKRKYLNPKLNLLIVL